VSALIVCREGDAIVVRTRDGALRFPGVAYFRELLRTLFRDAFAIRPPTPHRPRITLDHLVVAREQWRLRAADCTFAGSASALDRFQGLEGLARRLGWPRRVFYRVGNEQKPFLLDRANPLSVDDFAHQVRAAGGPEAPVVATEMLPAPDECWLADAQGRRYTCELRLTAVRPAGEPSTAR
jgi:hypothetical protein